ncbi:MAG TPA: magnesium transporter, partial [Actinotalea sp.]|nr:magnesium transporter [Actinotalea sp.]
RGGLATTLNEIARQSGAAPWAGHYMAATVWQLARYRALWLSLLLVAATLTVGVTSAFEATLEQVAALALFIPMLIGAGGNAGAQAATACVRALAVGEIRGSDLVRVVWRELRVGLLLGTLLAVLGLAVGTLVVGSEIAVVVGITLVLICGWAATIGGTMPAATASASAAASAPAAASSCCLSASRRAAWSEPCSSLAVSASISAIWPSSRTRRSEVSRTERSSWL